MNQNIRKLQCKLPRIHRNFLIQREKTVTLILGKKRAARLSACKSSNGLHPHGLPQDSPAAGSDATARIDIYHKESQKLQYEKRKDAEAPYALMRPRLLKRTGTSSGMRSRIS